MNKKNLLKFSLITFIIGIVIFFLAFFFFHYVTDEGITLIWHAEAGKPFIADLIGTFGVLHIFASVISFISAFVFFGGEK